MGFETPKIDPKRRAELEGKRTLETADLLKGGAEFVPDDEGNPALIVTEDQKTAAEKEMGKDFYKRYQRTEEQLERTEDQLEKSRGDIQLGRVVNGIEIVVGRDRINPKFYNIYLPQLSSKDRGELEKVGIYDPDLRFDDNAELAMEVYEYAAGLAKTGKDVTEVYKGVEKFIKEKR